MKQTVSRYEWYLKETRDGSENGSNLNVSQLLPNILWIKQELSTGEMSLQRHTVTINPLV